MRRGIVLLLLLLALVWLRLGETRATASVGQEATASLPGCLVPEEWGAYKGEWGDGPNHIGPVFEARNGTLRFLGSACRYHRPPVVVFEIRRR
jgi:hypothetical protein